MKENKNFYEIAVLVAGRKYPLVVSADEEAAVREIVKELNTQIDETHARYASRLGKQDIMAMLLLTYAKDLADAKARLQTVEAWLERLDDLDKRLDAATKPNSHAAQLD